MKRSSGLILGAVVALGVGGLLFFFSEEEEIREPERPTARPTTALKTSEPPASKTEASPKTPLFSAGFIDDSGYDLGVFYTPAILDRSSLTETVAAIRARAGRGRTELATRLGDLEKLSPRPADYEQRRSMIQVFSGLIEMYEGNFLKAEEWFERAYQENPGIDPSTRVNVGVLRGIASLRRGEIENCVECVGPSNCIFPIAPEARHLKPDGSRRAINYFKEALRERPDDAGVQWMLNIAAMTLGEYPDKVPPELRVPIDSSAPSQKIGRFTNIATESGISIRGPNMLGGSIFDDFNGDDAPDIFLTSGDATFGANLFLNRGDGTFEDSNDTVLDTQPLGVNASQADFDNDGALDVLILRGGWETPYRLSLLKNRGDGRFEDVTIAAGLAEPIASQTAAWGDFDNDGRLDLFIGGEFRPQPPDPRNNSRLYRNLGNGKFQNVASQAGVENQRWCKGAVWGDYDNDGDLDLYLSNMNGPNRLYQNRGDGSFVDVAPELKVDEPLRSFSCWFWDYDNDGRLDLFVTGFGANLYDVIADRLQRPTSADRPRLYRNLGKDGFRDVTREVGLDHVYAPMGSNFADVDNDGYLDFYLATGRPAYSFLTPNLLFRSVEGKRFEDVTTASGTGHLQKGHGVSFADHDFDGDLDLLVQTGGQAPGDQAHNVLFQNPGHPGRSIGLKLIGTRSNRSAIGARLELEFQTAQGVTRRLQRVVGSGSSFGGNSLAPLIGVGDASRVASLKIRWPGSQDEQVFKDLEVGKRYEIKESSKDLREIRKPSRVPKRAEARALPQ